MIRLFIWFSALLCPSFGFTQAKSSLRLGASPGVHTTTWSSALSGNSKLATAGFSLGATASYLLKDWSFNLAFHRSTSEKSLVSSYSHWEAFFSGASIGYSPWRNESWRFELDAGAGLQQYRLSQLANINSGTHLVRNDLVLTPAVALFNTTKHGLSTGLRMVYAFTPSETRSWKHAYDNSSLAISERRNNFTIQLLLGGLIPFK